MSPKKLHEVEILSGLIASYAKEHEIGSVIDLGAGQGYLSRVLAFQHQLCVLGVDSNTIQTCGAQTTQKRTEKLFVNKSKLKSTAKKAAKQQMRSEAAAAATTEETAGAPEGANGSACPSATPSPLHPDDKVTPSTSNTTTSTTATCSKKAKSGDRRSRSSSPSNSNSNCNGVSSTLNGATTREEPCKMTKVKKVKAKKISTCTPDVAITASGSANSAQHIPSSGSTSSNCNGNVDSANTSKSAASSSTSGAELNSANDPKLATTPGSNFQLQHITHHITAATLPTLLKEHFPKKSKERAIFVAGLEESPVEEKRFQKEDGEDERWTLCGLHACGDLTSNMIKLYLESSATCLFSVGCCYHWITERYDRNGNIVMNDGK